MAHEIIEKKDVLFEITKDHLETGLRGFPVGYCTSSSVDPLKGLFYVGQPVEQLARKEPEEVIYLLYFGKEGTAQEIKSFKEELKKRSNCSNELIQQIQKLPRKGHPMKLFSIALLLCGIFEGKSNYEEDCLNLIAKIPQIAATVINHHAGWGNAESNPELGYIQNFTQMVRVPNVKRDELKEIFSLFNILHYDHGGGNLSTFVGKAVASGLEDMYGSISAAMNALAGPRHGKANQECLEFVKKVSQAVGKNPTADDIEKFIRNALSNNQLIYGFGHAVLRVEDPRATVLYDEAQKLYSKDELVKIASLLRTQGSKVLKENPKISDPYPNVDAISGVLLHAAGFIYPEYYTVLFGLSRTVGIAIQIVYERCKARGGKGTPVVRPKYIYKPN